MKLNYYTDIEEMPVFNWFKIHGSGDVSFMLIKKKKITEKETAFLFDKFKDVYDGYIKLFGFNEAFLEVLEKKRGIALKMIKKAETGDKSINTLIKIEQLELERMQAQAPATSNFYEIKAFVEKKVGFQINIRQMSVAEFYTTLNSIKNG